MRDYFCLIVVLLFAQIKVYSQTEDVSLFGHDYLEYLAPSSNGILYYNGDVIVCSDGSVCDLPDDIYPVEYDGDSLSAYVGIIKYRFHPDNFNSIKNILHHNKDQYEIVWNYYTSDAGGNYVHLNLDIPNGNTALSKKIRNWLSETIYYKLMEDYNTDSRPMFLLGIDNSFQGEYIFDYYAREYLHSLYPNYSFEKEYVDRMGNSYCFCFSQQQTSTNYTTFFYSNSVDGMWFHPIPYQRYITFNNNNGEIITTEDIIEPGAEEEIKHLVIEELRKLYNEKNEDSLSLKEYKRHLSSFMGGLVNTIKKINQEIIQDTVQSDDEDFNMDAFKLPEPALFSEGIVFCFQPYEVGSFSEGFYMVYLPYDKLKKFTSVS